MNKVGNVGLYIGEILDKFNYLQIVIGHHCKTRANHLRVLLSGQLLPEWVSRVRPFLPWFVYRIVYVYLALTSFSAR